MEYLWVKVFHYFGVISWMAMLFYQPRLYVYHAEHIENKGFCDVVKIQESRLYHWIGWLAMIISIGTGTAMIFMNTALLEGGWLHAKITLVLIMVAYHLHLGYFMKQFAENKCTKSGKFFRMYNEVPTILMIGIVIFVVIKPF